MTSQRSPSPRNGGDRWESHNREKVDGHADDTGGRAYYGGSNDDAYEDDVLSEDTAKDLSYTMRE